MIQTTVSKKAKYLISVTDIFIKFGMGIGRGTTVYVKVYLDGISAPKLSGWHMKEFTDKQKLNQIFLMLNKDCSVVLEWPLNAPII